MVIIMQEPSEDLKSSAMFVAISEQLKGHPELVKKTQAIFLWNVTKNGKTATQWSKSPVIALLNSNLTDT